MTPFVLFMILQHLIFHFRVSLLSLSFLVFLLQHSFYIFLENIALSDLLLAVLWVEFHSNYCNNSKNTNVGKEVKLPRNVYKYTAIERPTILPLTSKMFLSICNKNKVFVKMGNIMIAHQNSKVSNPML